MRSALCVCVFGAKFAATLKRRVRRRSCEMDKRPLRKRTSCVCWMKLVDGDDENNIVVGVVGVVGVVVEGVTQLGNNTIKL